MPKKDEVYEERILDALRKFGADSGAKQTEIAKLLGYSQGHISRLLRREHHPGLHFLVALSKASNRTVDDILGLGAAAVSSEAVTQKELDAIQRLTDAAEAMTTPTRSTVRAAQKKGRSST